MSEEDLKTKSLQNKLEKPKVDVGILHNWLLKTRAAHMLLMEMQMTQLHFGKPPNADDLPKILTYLEHQIISLEVQLGIRSPIVLAAPDTKLH